MRGCAGALKEPWIRADMESRHRAAQCLAALTMDNRQSES